MTSLDATARVGDPPELIAALPYLLGFHPHDSLVLVATRERTGGRLGLTVRIDLPRSEHREEVADAVVGSLMLDAPAGAAVAVIGGGPGPPHDALVDRVVVGLERHHVAVHTAVWAESTAGGARWGCFGSCACGGHLPDPSTTVTAAVAVAGGQIALADRAELARLVAPSDARAIRRREKRLIKAHDRAVAAGGPPPEDRAGRVALVDAAIADAAACRLRLDDQRVVRLTLALADPLVRDTVMLRCAGPYADAAEQLWAALARGTPDPEAAEPAALLAVSALLRGRGALANVALDRAEQAWPGHRLTQLLRRATDSGMRPSAFRECLGLGPDDVEEPA
jgi:Domain of unknown function (DUF4192)